MAQLRLDFCSFHSARYAVENWHYSHSMPAGKLVKIGVWEDEQFIGAVIFGRGANNNSAKSFGLKQNECCELVRVALKEHETSVTRIISIALKILKKNNPGIQLVFSYADETNQGHKGIIYKAGNWNYVGERRASGSGQYWLIYGKLIHARTINSKYGGISNVPERLRSRMRRAPEQLKHLFTMRL